MRQAATAPRVIVWDVEDQWSALPGFRRVTTPQELAAIATSEAGPVRLAFVPAANMQQQFDTWAHAALHWGRHFGPCVVVAEELAGVSHAGKAPGWWHALLSRGLKRGITIYAISQRWAEADKTTIGNASRFVIFRALPMDAEYIARRAGVPLEVVQSLQPLEYLERDHLQGITSPVQHLKF